MSQWIRQIMIRLLAQRMIRKRWVLLITHEYSFLLFANLSQSINSYIIRSLIGIEPEFACPCAKYTTEDVSPSSDGYLLAKFIPPQTINSYISLISDRYRTWIRMSMCKVYNGSCIPLLGWISPRQFISHQSTNSYLNNSANRRHISSMNLMWMRTEFKPILVEDHRS